MKNIYLLVLTILSFSCKNELINIGGHWHFESGFLDSNKFTTLDIKDSVSIVYTQDEGTYHYQSKIYKSLNKIDIIIPYDKTESLNYNLLDDQLLLTNSITKQTFVGTRKDHCDIISDEFYHVPVRFNLPFSDLKIENPRTRKFPAINLFIGKDKLDNSSSSFKMWTPNEFVNSLDQLKLKFDNIKLRTSSGIHHKINIDIYADENVNASLLNRIREELVSMQINNINLIARVDFQKEIVFGSQLGRINILDLKLDTEKIKLELSLK